MKRIIHASLFSGIGGFDLAAEWLGFRNAFHCEINPFCEKILKYHFPDAEHYTDITRTDFTPWRGKIDMLSGGFPCQPFSLAGQRKGAEDDRYLWPQMLRAIREIQPDWVVGENVAGILSMVQPGKEVEVGRSTSLFGEDYTDEEMHRQYVVETVCTDLEREGYSVQPFVIPACAVGAPHRRDRVWFVALRTDAGSETLQCGRKDGIHADRVAPHPDEYRHTPCTAGGGTETERQERATMQGERPVGSQRTDGLSGLQRDAADTLRTGRQELDAATKPREALLSDSEGDARRNTCNHDGSRLEGGGARSELQGREYGFADASLPADRWCDFPTQSPVRSRDDGFPVPMDGITFSKWRQESIKAYGNAIVPQVAYEIFQAIINSYE